MILGKNLIMTLGLGYTGFACSKSCTLSIETDFIETCSPVGGSWREYIPTTKSWSANVDTLLAKIDDHKRLFEIQDLSQMVLCSFFDVEMKEYYRGYCYIKNLQLKGSVGGLATMTVNIQPTGALEVAKEQTIDWDGVVGYNKVLGLVVGSNTISIMNRDYPDEPQLRAKELTISKDTRITIKRAVVVNAPLETVEPWVMSKEHAKISNNAILIETSYKEKSAIIKTVITKKITVLQNDTDAAKYPIKYLSKF